MKLFQQKLNNTTLKNEKIKYMMITTDIINNLIFPCMYQLNVQAIN